MKDAVHLGLGRLLAINAGLFTHGGQDNNVGFLAIFVEHLADLLAHLAVGKLDVVLGGAIVGHEGQETVIGHVKKLVFLTADVGNVHVVGGRAQFLQLLASKDVDSNKMNLSVAVLSGLRGGHVDNLARTALDHDVTVFAQSGTLHGEGGRRTSVGALEGVLLMLRVVGHGCRLSRTGGVYLS